MGGAGSACPRGAPQAQVLPADRGRGGWGQGRPAGCQGQPAQGGRTAADGGRVIMMAESPHSPVEPLLTQLSGTFAPDELDQVRRAYEFADRWHEGQWRKSGDPYITHPLAVAEAAAAAPLDSTMVCAALLHDVLEDTDCDPRLLRAEFGDE